MHLFICSTFAFFAWAAYAFTAQELLIHNITDLYSFQPTNNLTATQRKQDLQYLGFALRKGYSGPQEAARLLRLAEGAIDTASTLTSTSTLTSLQFCNALDKILRSVRDSHLRLFLNFEMCSAPLGQGQVGPNSGTHGATWSMRLQQIFGREVAIVAIPRFASQEHQQWQGFLATIQNLKEQNRSWILDLRGNTGGDDAMGIEMARILYGLANSKVRIPSPLKQMIYLRTPEAFALQANAWSYQIARAKSAGRTSAPELEQKRGQYIGYMNEVNVAPFAGPYIANLEGAPESLSSDQVFSDTLMILVDRLCASACETTLQTLEKLPKRILVGETTLGAVEYGDVGMVRLPNSHLMVQLATERNVFTDDRHPERSGYVPNVLVPPGEDALLVALKMLGTKEF